MGMLAWFVHGYNDANMLTPNYILILFIVSTLALAWAIFTLFSYHRSSHNARFVGFVDLAFVGAFIAGVYYLRFITKADCSNIKRGSAVDVTFGIFGSATINGLEVSLNKTCAMLKAAFAFGIMNCLFFFVTAVMAWFHGDTAAVKEKKYVVERSSSRHHDGRRSHSHGRSHGGSHHGSRRSSHSHSRAYV